MSYPRRRRTSNTKRCRIYVTDVVPVNYAKRPPIVTGGALDPGRASTSSPYAPSVKR